MRLRTKRRTRQRGFTLMEVLLVLAILVILGSMVGIYFIGVQKRGYSDAARTQIGMFEQQLKVFYLDVGRYPTSDEGLQALRTAPGAAANKWRGPYSEKEIPTDPWGMAYQYELAGSESPKIWSLGPDMANGTEDDVTNE